MCLVFAGCGSSNRSTGFTGIEREVFPVVETYLDNAASGNWNEVFETLSGEALAEARANSGRAKAGEKIISKDLKLTPVCQDIIEVSADFTKSSGGGFDRLAYSFRLKKTGDRWLIYKTSYSNYHHGELKPGQFPSEGASIVKTYLELPFMQKRNSNKKFLAGKLLEESEKAKMLPVDSKIVYEQEKIVTRVKGLECLGTSDDFAVVKVNYEVIRGNVPQTMEALADIINVNGAWKICRMDISQL
ncbi:MAG: hypothetical protein ACOY40_04805 [Bacillota bacterium]